MRSLPRPAWLHRAASWARHVRRDVLALWIAARDPRVARPVKWLCVAIAAYAFSPIDLIPDFIPVLGYLDDLVLVPLAILLAVRLIPRELLDEFRREAERRSERPVSRLAAGLVVLAWILAVVLVFLAIWPGLVFG
ncbi:YkvA family protein [Geminicoccus roseus]|uniref:YkvA family protein n=1 Tax=Geminicoccus roseus TaxID=404900 RepID=UPI00055283A1|nr:YkvA family protein [Geminicoccus roseus]